MVSTFWMQGLSDVHSHARPQPASPQGDLAEEEVAQTQPSSPSHRGSGLVGPGVGTPMHCETLGGALNALYLSFPM